MAGPAGPTNNSISGLTVTDLPDGGHTYSYTVGATEADSYDADGNLTKAVLTNTDGSHYTEIDGNGQTVQALGNDTFSDLADNTRFVFHHGFGTATIYGFETAGPGHDSVVLPAAADLVAILANATSDSDGSAVLHFGPNDSITFAGVSVADLQAHQNDFKLSKVA